ncbi:LysR family transcriptional regulator [Amycolatopsis anabasis]|uniref:LysR family transcriptional regulator n=1 Tax=Amycolatopsis anabasis TaxID=1840409 RepID=UPI001FE9FE84|nr:LysR family transcriptional regulator [Amycolatopsis anabasis]
MLREIARAGSYSAAARSLGYTQPAVSQQMRALERAVGTPLTVKAGRKVVFTDAGRELLRHAEVVLRDIAAAETSLAAIAGRRAGRVRLVVFPSGSATLVPPAAAEVRRRHPEIALSLTEAEPPESIDLVRAGECDIALAFDYPDTAEETNGLLRLPLLSDPLIALLPAEHALAARPAVRLTELADEPWIGGCPRCQEYLFTACSAEGFTPDLAFATDDNLAVQSLVAAGLGVAVIPQLLLAAARHADLATRPVEPEMRRAISAFIWPELSRVPTIRVVLDALGEAARSPRTDPLPAG